MVKFAKAAILILLLNCQTALAQEPNQPSQEGQSQESQKQETKKEIKKMPRKFEFEFGHNWTQKRSKIDPDGLPFRIKPFLGVASSILSDSAHINASFQWEPNGLGSKSFKLRADDNSLKFGKSLIAVGPSVYYFKSDEHAYFIKDVGLAAHDFTQKDYGLFGVNVRYGHTNKPNVRVSYMLGAVYLREYGVFDFKNTKETVKKLYNRDIQPLDMISVGVSLPNIWRFDLEGGFTSLQTRQILGHSNTKEFVPTHHMILDGSAKIKIWKNLYLSTSGTYTNNDYGAVFFGKSAAVKLGLRF